MSKLNIVPEGHNKSVYFVLPWFKKNSKSYGEGNFVNTYISYNGNLIVVIYNKSMAGEYWKDEHYKTDFDVEIIPGIFGTAIIYGIPPKLTMDFAKFLDGRYSGYSPEAKALVNKYSGLPYGIPIPGSSQVSTHKLLLVLDCSEVLRQWMEIQLDTIILPGTELLAKPDDTKEYMDIDTIII